MGTQVLSAHVPLLLHRSAQRVLVIGLGSGVTLGSAGRYPVSVLHCAELDPAVVEGARLFASHNFGVHDDPRTQIFVADGRNFLLASPDKYDVIISEPSNPWMAGVANLFTAEFYELAKQRLGPGGIMAQWIQLYRIFPSDVKLLLKTFQEAFPYMSVWSTIPGDLLLIGSMEAHQLDGGFLNQQFAVEAIREDLERVGVIHPQAFLELFWLGREQVEQVTADVSWVHQDDRPWIEFSAPRALYVKPTFSVNHDGLSRFKAPKAVMAPTLAAQEPSAASEMALGHHYRFRQEGKKAIEAFERAVTLDPNSVEVNLRLAELYEEHRLPLKAQEALRRVLAVEPDSGEAHRLLARSLQRQDKLTEALDAYESLAELGPPNSSLAEEIGHALKQANRTLEAAEYFRSARSQDEQDRVALALSLAQMLKELGHLEEAERILASTMDRHANDPMVSVRLGELLLEQDRMVESKQVFERVIATTPSVAAAYVGLGEVAFKEGQFREAAKHFKAGLLRDPYNAKALKTLQETQRRIKSGSST